MFSNVRWVAPKETDDWKTDYRNLVKSINDHFLALERPESLRISSATFDGVIGGNTPAAGSFTDVNASGKVDADSYGSFGNDGTIFGKSNASLSANSDLDTTMATSPAGSGIFIVRNNTDGGVIVASADMGTGTVTIISDPSGYGAVGADPGAASSKFWLTVTGSIFRIRNRYAAAKSVGVCNLTLGGSPS